MHTIKRRFFIALTLYILGMLSTPLLGRDLATALLSTVVLGLAFVLSITAWVLNVPTSYAPDGHVQP